MALRFFNIVGPRQVGRYGMVLPRFVAQARQGEPITVFGDGEQRRSFTYVKDAVRAGSMSRPVTLNPAVAKPTRVGSPT